MNDIGAALFAALGFVLSGFVLGVWWEKNRRKK